MEVMGLMLGEFVDEYTVRCVDVFAMPQSGTSVSVESVDPVFQQQMLDMLKLTGRPEAVVGWYHSHPGFGCWLSGVDCNTQQVRARACRQAPHLQLAQALRSRGLRIRLGDHGAVHPQLSYEAQPGPRRASLGHRATAHRRRCRCRPPLFMHARLLCPRLDHAPSRACSPSSSCTRAAWRWWWTPSSP